MDSSTYNTKEQTLNRVNYKIPCVTKYVRSLDKTIKLCNDNGISLMLISYIKEDSLNNIDYIMDKCRKYVEMYYENMESEYVFLESFKELYEVMQTSNIKNNLNNIEDLRGRLSEKSLNILLNNTLFCYELSKYI